MKSLNDVSEMKRSALIEMTPALKFVSLPFRVHPVRLQNVEGMHTMAGILDFRCLGWLFSVKVQLRNKTPPE